MAHRSTWFKAACGTIGVSLVPGALWLRRRSADTAAAKQQLAPAEALPQNTNAVVLLEGMHRVRDLMSESAWDVNVKPCVLRPVRGRAPVSENDTLPSVEVLRLTETFEGAPVLRIIAHLPGVTTDELCKMMCDVTARKSWDDNYAAFFRCAGASAKYPARLVDGEGKAMKSVPPQIQVIDDDVYFHRVTSKNTVRFGILPRSFLYNRVMLRYKSEGSNDNAKYVVLYRSLPEGAVGELGNILAAGGVHDMSKDVLVKSHYQLLELVPQPGGASMIFTTCNDVQAHMPRWAERIVAQHFTVHAYQQLYQSILSEKA